MEPIIEREWTVAIDGYKKDDQEIMIKIKEQVNIFINDYNNHQRQIDS